ncbi:hypothetical protein [Brochothrix thermosphacta]|uniref:Uncharacterized protein n=1 Tax=Brochothrix thermosphacta TaxID=2756 RepID=A0A2X0S6V8_BROTH|nr:hypothetical protein [Brochothrix thermosphacta]SPP28452.1 conserved hypothetical protein [Brochothrix thermosphacta]
MDPQLIEAGITLAEVSVRHTAANVLSSVKAMKAAGNDKQAVTKLSDLILELLEEKQEIELIAKAYQNELISQKLSEDDLNYIVKTVLPILKKFLQNMADTQDGEEKDKTLEFIATIDTIEPLLSLSSLNVLQLIGFNFKQGIGEPLTELLKNTINGANKVSQTKYNELLAEREIEYFRIMQDEAAYDRLVSLQD